MGAGGAAAGPGGVGVGRRVRCVTDGRDLSLGQVNAVLQSGVVPNALMGRSNSLYSLLTCTCPTDVVCTTRKLLGHVFCRDATAALTHLLDGILAVSCGVCFGSPPGRAKKKRVTSAAWRCLHLW